MTLSHRVFMTLVILLISNEKWGQGLKVQFYENENYQGLLQEKMLSAKEELEECIDLDTEHPILKSVKTDKCLIAYDEPYCGGHVQPPSSLRSAAGERTNVYSFRVDGDTPSLGPFRLASFHACSQELGGGPQLDVDVYVGEWDDDDENICDESYRGVCSCRNLPRQCIAGKTKHFAIFTHGNSVNVYEGENCQGKSKYIFAGSYAEQQAGNYPFDVRSFEPAELKNCYRLDAEVTKFEFKNGTDSIDDFVTENVQLAAGTDIIKNDGASEITQRFRVSSKITETVGFSVAESFTGTHAAGVEDGAKVTVEAGVPLISSAEVTTGIIENYEWSQENSGEKSNTTIVSKEEAVEIEQEIKIPPCKVCYVSTFVTKLKNFPVSYTATAMVFATGDASAEEVKENLPAGLIYEKDIDENSVEVSTDGTMYVDFGIKSIINVTCNHNPIKGCEATSVHPDDHQVYDNVPIKFIGRRLSLTRSRRSSILSFLQNAVSLIVKNFN